MVAYFVNILKRFMVGVDDELGGPSRRCVMAQTMLPASRLWGVHERFESKVRAVDEQDGSNRSSGCSCSKVAAKPSRLGSRYKHKRRVLSATAS